MPRNRLAKTMKTTGQKAVETNGGHKDTSGRVRPERVNEWRKCMFTR